MPPRFQHLSHHAFILITINQCLLTNVRNFRYLITLTIAPCFFSAAIYVSFSRLVRLHGSHCARFKPRSYTIIFIVWDVISLALQAAGGGLADTGADGGSGQTGINIMIAGLSSQVASMAIFAALCGDYAWRRRRAANAGIETATEEKVRGIGLSMEGHFLLIWCKSVLSSPVFPKPSICNLDDRYANTQKR